MQIEQALLLPPLLLGSTPEPKPCKDAFLPDATEFWVSAGAAIVMQPW